MSLLSSATRNTGAFKKEEIVMWVLLAFIDDYLRFAHSF